MTAAAADIEGGAAEIARRAAEALAAIPSHDLEAAVVELVRAHPSMAPLWRLASDVLDADDHAAVAAAFARSLADEPRLVARHAADVLPAVVVTLSYSGTLVAGVAAAGATAVCARSEPGGEGERTARVLRERGIEARLIPDDEAIARARSGDCVVVGADSVGPGGLVNKALTGTLATAARSAGAPALAVAGTSKLVAADIPAPPPFERTPLALFTSIVTDEGVLSPPIAARRAAEFRLHPRLAQLLRTMV